MLGNAIAVRVALGVAIGSALLAMPAFAQVPACVSEDSDCAAGSCPLQNLPYEEFIAAPPSSVGGGRDIPPVADRPFDPESGPRILVRGFQVDGVNPHPEAGVTQQTAQAAADQAFVRETGGAPDVRMTVGHMVRVADQVTTFYRSHGYVVSKAFVPVQTIGPDSVVHIQVVEGRVSDVVVEGAKHYSPSVLRKPARGLIGQAPTRDSVETAVLYTQDYPGVRLFGTFKPGANTGDTNLVLQVLSEDRFSYQLGADNYGTPLTGQYRLRGDVAWNNPLGFGDVLSVTALEALQPSNTTYGSIGYRVPFGPRGLQASIGASQNAFVVSKPPFDFLQLHGKIQSYDAGLDWKFLRERFLNAHVGLDFANRHSTLTARDTLAITDDQFNVISLETGADRVDTRFKGVDQVAVRIRQGAGGKSKSATNFGSFTVYGLDYTRVQAAGETQTAILHLRTQYTNKPVSPLEEFALAGPDAVRAYPVGQLLKDNARFVSFEYRVQAPGFSRAAGPFGRQWGDLLSLSVFGDYAYGKSANRNDGAELSGAGLGLNFGVPGSVQFQLQGAEALSQRVANDGKKFRLYGELSYKF